MFWRWTLNVVLLGITLWLANLTAYNWWAGGGPPGENPEQFIERGNVFLVLTCLSFVGFLVVLVKNIRQARRGRKGE